VVLARGATVNGRAAAAGAEVPPGAALAISRRGLAEIDLANGRRVRLFPGARATLAPASDAVELTAGRLWCVIEPQRGPFRVRTVHAEVRVLGTSFVVERTGRDTDVRVVKGTVEVEDAGRRGTVRVAGGEHSRVLPRAAPRRAQRYAAGADENDWDRFVRRLTRALKRTFRSIEQELR
jgi:ferric-dicitrate binding protein FerR (iron transport regulator)